MKLLFFSDVHGMPATLEQLLKHADELCPDRLVLLGDALYHGPRNGVPSPYDPPAVAALLNQNRERILAVRGTCDSEVDQMLLQFPIYAEFSEILTPEARFFATHGHLWNKDRLPPVPQGTILVHGHTHIPVNQMLPEGIRIFNPGSISLPKQNFPRSFGFWDGERLSVRRLDDGSEMAL